MTSEKARLSKTLQGGPFRYTAPDHNHWRHVTEEEDMATPHSITRGVNAARFIPLDESLHRAHK